MFGQSATIRILASRKLALAIACALVVTLVHSATTQAATITLDGTSGSNTISSNYSTDGGLDINLGFFTQYLIVGGGGGGGNGTNSTNQRGGGGGGAGGLLTNVGGSLLQVTAASHPVVVGAGGIANGTNRAGSNGGDSSFASITALGGGGGGGQSGGNAGKAGGSGGGGAGATSTSGLGGAGTPGQGNNGGNGDRAGAGYGGGGGGAGQAGRNGQNSPAVRGGYGGDGLQNDITGTNLYYAGGGGGRDSAGTNPDSGEGGLGGGGDAAQPGTDGLGGGGGGSLDGGAKNGGSGVVVVRYAGSQAGTGGAISTVGGDTVHQFTSVGSSALDLSGLDLNARLGVTLTGMITGSGDLTFNGPGRLTLAANNTYTGATTVNAGTLQAGVASIANVSGAFGNNSAVTMANVAGATLDLDGFNTQIGSLTGGGALGGNVTLGTATLTVGADNTSPAPYAGVISGDGGLTKIGNGALTLSGNNSYQGLTSVTDGTILVNGDNSAATGNVTVDPGATLGGSGTVGGLTAISGVHAPGASAGIQSFGGGLTYNSGMSLEWELFANTSTGRGSSFDGVDVNGADLMISAGAISELIFDGTGSTVDWTDPFWDTDQSWLVFDNASAPTLASSAIFDNILVSNDWLNQPFTASIGSFSWQQIGNDVYLNFTAASSTLVPEPSIFPLALLGLISLAWCARRRRQVKHATPAST